MSYWNALGREVILRSNEDTCERISQHMAFLGIESSVSVDPDTGGFVVSVSQADFSEASQILLKLNAKDTDADIQHYEEEYKTASPRYVTAEIRYTNSMGFSMMFLSFAAFVFFIALLQLLSLLRSGGSVTDRRFAYAALGLGAAFLFTGMHFLVRAGRMKKLLCEENAFTLQVIEWCISSYPAVYIDQAIKADSNNPLPVTCEDVTQRRKALITSYINREFNVPDPAYLRYLAEETHAAIFEKGRLREDPGKGLLAHLLRR